MSATENMNLRTRSSTKGVAWPWRIGGSSRSVGSKADSRFTPESYRTRSKLSRGKIIHFTYPRNLRSRPDRDLPSASANATCITPASSRILQCRRRSASTPLFGRKKHNLQCRQYRSSDTINLDSIKLNALMRMHPMARRFSQCDISLETLPHGLIEYLQPKHNSSPVLVSV